MAGILFIDAEQPFADQMVGALKGKGFTVKLLDDGKDGLDLAKSERPDLIVLCVELPKMSGYSICNKLKKDNDLKGIPLIITSKEATPETFAQHKKLKTRAEDYLIKPFSEGELVEKIGALIPLPAAGASAGNGAAKADDGFDALESLGADLNLGSSPSGGEGDIKLDDTDFASLDGGGSAGKAPDGLGLSADDDALLASLDDLGGGSSAPAPAAAPSAIPGLDDLELGGNVKDEGLGTSDLGNLDGNLEAGLEASFDAIAPDEPAAPPPPPAKPARAESKPAPAPAPVASTASVPPTSTADLQQLNALRRENSDMKAKVAELEAKLKASEETVKSKDAQIAAAASSSGGGGGGGAREVLNLKEQLRAKEKEIGQLKDEVFEKEKANVDLQEQMEQVNAEAQKKMDLVKQKDVEISTLNGKIAALTEERDQLEQQVQERAQQAEQEKAQLRGEIEQAKSDARRAKSDLERQQVFEDKLKSDLDRAKAEIENQKKAAAEQKAQLEGKIKEAENEARSQEDRALKAYQRLKSEEAVRERAKKAVEIAFTLLSGDVEASKKTEGVDLELDAE